MNKMSPRTSSSRKPLKAWPEIQELRLTALRTHWFVDAEEIGPLLRRFVADGEGRQCLEQRTAPLGKPIPALVYGTFLSNRRRLFKEAGLSSPDFGVHSLRAGGVTTAVNAVTFPSFTKMKSL